MKEITLLVSVCVCECVRCGCIANGRYASLPSTKQRKMINNVLGQGNDISGKYKQFYDKVVLIYR